MPKLVHASEKGRLAELAACEYLTSRGLQCRKKNHRCRHGEIDLIMDHDDMLVFVEVRLRNNTHFGDACESVSPRKQQKITKAALHYLSETPLLDEAPCRFDVIAMTSNNNTYQISWIKDAFSV